MRFEKLYLTSDSFFWFVDGLGIFLFQTDVLRMFWLHVFVVHVDHAKDVAISKSNAF
jgi:hypothetical protein